MHTICYFRSMLRFRKILWLFLIIGFFACTQVKEKVIAAEPAPVHLLKNELFSIQPLKKYTVVFFVASDCPLCKSYRPMIKAMSDSFASIRGDWNMVVFHEDAPTGPDETYTEDYGIVQLQDREKRIANLFRATVVPQVFVVDSMSNVLYHGAIDNYASENGKHRTVATEHYLKDALNALKKGREVSLRSTKPAGCYIE
jgi:thioredoxin-related protein